MARNPSVLTPDQVKALFRQRGVTFTTWAKERGYPRKLVYEVVNGQNKATYGRGHEIAVALGLKPSTSGLPGNPQSKFAA